MLKLEKNYKWPRKEHASGPRGKLNESHRWCLEAMREAGLGRREMARELGVNFHVVTYKLYDWGMTCRHNRHIAVDRADEVRSLLASGYTQRQIADHFGVCRETVRLYLRKHGIERPERAPSPLDGQFAAVRELWESGWTQAQIGEHYGVSQPDVSEFMRKNGVLLMNRSKKS